MSEHPTEPHPRLPDPPDPAQVSGWPSPPPPPPSPSQPHPPASPPPAARRPGRIVAAILAALLLVGAGAGLGWGLTRDQGSPRAIGGSSNGQAATSLDVQAIADRVEPAVVDINTEIQGSFGQIGRGAGTGMLLTSSGEVLTNNHVIQGATKIEVSITGRSGTYPATVVGVDFKDDVALLQVQGVSGLPTVTLADSSDLVLGQEVVAMGNALGQGGSPSVSEGTVSALERSITVVGEEEPLTGLIQMDAPIQPGDSGGPLVDSSARVVGMITAAARSNFGQSISSIGFAIPTNDALGIVREIRAGNETSTIVIGPTGFLGVGGVQDLDSETAARLGLNVTSGALILSVRPGAPAESAGITPESVITGIGGQRVSSADALRTAIYQHDPGEQIRVTWVDGSGTHSATVRLITSPIAV
ncbi:MAG TPA: trypsin-like peptidase domain-containing protein [Actinomycetota bacterium]